jgi:peptidyl-prolyl cis-trans isomerase D
VKDALTKDIQRDAAGDAIAKTANDIDDATAGGASFEQTVKKFGLKTQTIAAIDAQGRGPDGKPIDLPQPSEAVLQQAFTAGQGQTSPLSELGDEGYFLVHVDKVTPAEVRPLADARQDVVVAWQAQQRKDALEKLAASMVGDVNGGKSLKDVAAAHKLAMTTSQPLSRTSDAPTAPPSLIAALFSAKPNAAVSASAGDNVIVAQLKTIQPADPAQDQAGVKQLTNQLSASMKSDMLNAYTQTLRTTFPVEINQTNLDHVL